MKRILLRAAKGPFDVVSLEATLRRNTVADNSGNLIFSHAAHKILRTNGIEVHANGNRRNPADAAMINERYDAFVVPLANAFRLSFESHLRRLTEVIEGLTIPVVVFGVGAQTGLNYDVSRLEPITESVKRFMAAVLERSATVGVRGEFTEAYLKGLGFKDIEVIGCPSMFMYGENLRVEKKAAQLTAKSKISINVSPYVKAMGKVVEHHYRAYPNLSYIAQDTKTLGTLLLGDAPDDAGKTSAVPIYRSHPLFTENKVRFFADPWTWLSYLTEFDFAFGTRIHGNIAALLAGTPSYVLAHDSRTLELSRYFEIPHRRVTRMPAGLDAAELYDEADYTGLNNGQHERLVRMTDFLDRNGLDHIFNHGGDSTEFDRLVKRTRFPGPATVLTAEHAKKKDGRRFRSRVVAAMNLRAVRVQRRSQQLQQLASRAEPTDSGATNAAAGGPSGGVAVRARPSEHTDAPTIYARTRRALARALRRTGRR